MPRGLQVAAAWSWRVILVVVVIFIIGWLARYLSEVFVPIAIAIPASPRCSPRWPTGREAGVVVFVAPRPQ